MYAVIRTGGKQYRVAPGDVVKIESIVSDENQTIEFSDVLAVSGEPGTVAKPSTAKVIAEVMGEGRGEKILVFHLKRKKQYKKLQGHRQNFTEVRIKAIEADGVTYSPAYLKRNLKLEKEFGHWHIRRVEAAPQPDATPMHSGWA
ncbi:MAG: 50S ribosomal protein L21 [Terracidiphilus sp.]